MAIVVLTRSEMAPNLKDKVCLVTGATKGIGRGIALYLGSCGAKVSNFTSPSLIFCQNKLWHLSLITC